MFWADFERFGDDVALISEAGQQFSYSDLARLADAAGFRSRPRALVLMAMANDVPSLAAYLGCLRSGHAVILADARAPDAVEELIATYRPNLVWTEAQGLVERVGPGPEALNEDLAVLLTPTVTTDGAMLVRLSRAAIASNAESICGYLRIDPAARVITSLSPATASGLSVINSQLNAGAVLVLTNRGIEDPEFVALMHRERVTSMAGVPSTYEGVAALGLLDRFPSSMAALTQAGGRLRPEQVARIREAAARRDIRFVVMSGQTEAPAGTADLLPPRPAQRQNPIEPRIVGGRFEPPDPDGGVLTDAAGAYVSHGPAVLAGCADLTLERQDVRGTAGQMQHPVERKASAIGSEGLSGASPLEAYGTFLARLGGTARVDDETCFARIGGDTGASVEASLLVKRLLGAVPSGWETLTLRQLAERTGARPAPAVPPVRLQRLPYIESLRSIAILLVVAAHTSTAFLYIDPTAPNEDPLSFFSFRHINAVFILIAGFLFQYLLGKFDYKKYLKAKSLNVIVPYVLISIPAIAVYLIGLKSLGALGAPAFVNGKLEFTLYMLVTGTQLGPLWFIPMMVLFYLFAPLFQTIDRHPTLYWVIVPLLIASYGVGRSIDDSDPAQAMIFYLPVYLAGMAACRYRFRLMPHLVRWWPFFVVAVFIPNLVAEDAAAYEMLALLSKVAFGLGLMGALARFGGWIPEKFRVVGELSFGIFFIHGYVIGIAVAIAKHNELFFDVLDSFAGSFLAVTGISLVAVLAIKRILGGRSRLVIGA